MTTEQGTGTPTTTPGEQPPSTGAESSPTNLQTTATTETAPATPPAEVAVDYKFDVPEGMSLDEGGVQEFTTIAKELKLPQDAAKRLMDLEVKRIQGQQEQHLKLVESWSEAAKTDKEIGGDKLTENLAVAKRAVDTFGSPALKELLNQTGLGNHPEVIRAFYKAGQAIREDGFVRGQPKGAATESDLAKSLFPTMNR